MSEIENDGTIYSLNKLKATFALELVTELVTEQDWEPDEFICVSNLGFIKHFSGLGSPLPQASNFMVELLVGQDSLVAGNLSRLETSFARIIELSDPDFVDSADLELCRTGEEFFIRANIRLLWRIS
jgi:hypothetical protein